MSNGLASPDVIVAGACGVAVADVSLLAICCVPAGAISGRSAVDLGRVARAPAS